MSVKDGCKIETVEFVIIQACVIASKAKQSRSAYFQWIASSLTLLAMTEVAVTGR
jgi:hypothetical protein